MNVGGVALKTKATTNPGRAAHRPRCSVTSKSIALGMLLPAALAMLATRVIIQGEAKWYGSNLVAITSTEVGGVAAIAIALSLYSIAGFLHSRYVWRDVLGAWRIASGGEIASLLTWLASVIYVIVNLTM